MVLQLSKHGRSKLPTFTVESFRNTELWCLLAVLRLNFCCKLNLMCSYEISA